MTMDLMILAKSDKHNGCCVAGINKVGKFVRLVRDKEGHALEKSQCKFKKLDILTVEAHHAPLEFQKENYILSRLINTYRSSVSIGDLKVFVQNPLFIFSNTNPWLDENEMNRQKSTFVFARVNNLYIFRNDEGKYKADFTYNNQEYKGFSITDPEFKLECRKILNAYVLVSLPSLPYNKYGKELYYKFICAVYPIKKSEKSYLFDSYKI